MILTVRYESNPKGTVWNGSEKFMSLKKHLSPIYTVPFADILRKNEKWSFLFKKNIAILFLSAALSYLMHVYCIPTVHNDYYEPFLRSLPENQIFL